MIDPALGCERDAREWTPALIENRQVIARTISPGLGARGAAGDHLAAARTDSLQAAEVKHGVPAVRPGWVAANRLNLLNPHKAGIRLIG